MSNAKNFCSNCGEKIAQGNSFCTKCGLQLTNSPRPTDNTEHIETESSQNYKSKPANTNNTSSPIWYFFTVFCGFIGGIISFLILRKHHPKKAKICLIVGIAFTIIPAGTWAGLQETFGTQNPFYVVSTDSMMPEMQVYDIIIADAKIPFQDITVGDIIVFKKPIGDNRVIVHRVADILDNNPLTKTIRAKGDANPVSIPGTDYPITDREYIGKVVHVIPQLGYVTRVLAPPINYLIVLVIAVVAVVSHFGYKRDLKKK